MVVFPSFTMGGEKKESAEQQKIAQLEKEIKDLKALINDLQKEIAKSKSEEELKEAERVMDRSREYESQAERREVNIPFIYSKETWRTRGRTPYPPYPYPPYSYPYYPYPYYRQEYRKPCWDIIYEYNSGWVYPRCVP
jgi:hypothetical protein